MVTLPINLSFKAINAIKMGIANAIVAATRAGVSPPAPTWLLVVKYQTAYAIVGCEGIYR